MRPVFGQTVDLVERVANAIHGDRRVVFLLGSGATMPRNGAPGVPSAAGLVEMIRLLLGPEALPKDVSYQDAFDTLITKRGQDAANKVIQDAVLRARRNYDAAVVIKRDPEELVKLEERLEDWEIPHGIAGLAAVIAHHPRKFGEVILTTNFDPLIEIALTRARVSWHSTSLHSDGSLLYLRGSGSGVIHLHGYWWGSDTLNSAVQLTAKRPQLGASLGHILSNSLLVVLGYGGWEDIMMHALAEVLSANDFNRSVDVLWAFHCKNEDAIIEGSKIVLNTLESAKLRAHFYRGVDIDEFGMELFKSVVQETPAESLPLFFERMFDARNQPSIYRNMASPWGCETGGVIGEYVQDLAKFDVRLPPAAALVLVELQLPRLERQPVHQAPNPRQFGWVRSSLLKAWSAIRKVALSDEEVAELANSATRALEASGRVECSSGEAPDAEVLRAAAYAIAAVVALRRGVSDLLEDPVTSLALSGLSSHLISRSLYDEEIHVAAHLAARMASLLSTSDSSA